MPSRSLPSSDTQHLDALRDALFQLDTLPAGRPTELSPETIASLRRLYPLWSRVLKERRNVGGQRTEATAAADAAKARLRLLLSHFLQNLNFAIEREDAGFRPGDRTLYGMDASQVALPRMERETELLRVAESAIEGEAKRTSAGGRPILMPPVGAIESARRTVLERLRTQHQHVTAHDEESAEVMALRGNVEELVKDIWDELEFAYRKEPASAMRRRCRQWGVVYTRDAGEEEEVAAPAPRAVAEEVALPLLHGSGQNGSGPATDRAVAGTPVAETLPG